MSYNTDGSVHHIGVRNEHAMTEVFTTLPIRLVQKDGTGQVDVIQICQEVERRYDERMERIYTLKEGGELRAARGELVEKLFQDCCELIGFEHRKGGVDKQKIVLREHSKQHQVDGHVYNHSRLVMFSECKAYLDACYYERACNDFRIMKIKYPDLPCIVVSLENSLADDARVFTDTVFDYSCNQIFFLCEGKRSSSKPLYKREYTKKLNVQPLVEYLLTVYDSSQSILHSVQSQ
jgi:hypothetical protein